MKLLQGILVLNLNIMQTHAKKHNLHCYFMKHVLLGDIDFA